MAQYRAQGISLTNMVRKNLDAVGKEFLIEMSNFLVDNSPVWSGSYVTSHKLGEKSVAGQFTKTIRGGPNTRVSNPESYKESARASLLSTVSSLSTMPNTISFGNTAPHAAIVEYGGGRTQAYAVYSQARREAGNMLARAVARVKGTS